MALLLAKAAVAEGSTQEKTTEKAIWNGRVIAESD